MAGRRYDQCDDTCTTDCGRCKGAGRPASVPPADSALRDELAEAVADRLNGEGFLGCEEWTGERDTGCPDCDDLWRIADKSADAALAVFAAHLGQQQEAIQPDEDDCGHHSWAGLMSLLDEHWPDDIFPTAEDDIARDAGARIVSLIRWVDRLRASQPANGDEFRELIRCVNEQAWTEGYDACRRGEQRHNPFRRRAALGADL